MYYVNIECITGRLYYSVNLDIPQKNDFIETQGIWNKTQKAT